MAKPTTKTYKDFLIRVKTGPTTWTAPAGFISKSLNLQAGTSAGTVPDKDDPEAATWDENAVDSLSGQVQGQGVMAAEDSPMWDGWFDSAEPKEIQIITLGVGYRQGMAVLTNLGDSVALKTDANLVQRNVTLQNSGAWPWTAGNPSDLD